MISLNSKAFELCDQMARSAESLRITIEQLPCGTRWIDCGINTPGGLEAGRLLAEICMAGLGTISLVPRENGPVVAVRTDHPVAACLASQYAGWQMQGDDFFAMGSGPMRAAAAREEIFDDIGHVEKADCAVGVLETAMQPTDAVCLETAEKCGVAPERLILLGAPTRSIAGSLQVVARSVETTLHKLHELKFDLSRLVSGFGTAPLPPMAKNDLAAIGRTNDAILYGGQTTLYVQGDDESLQTIGPQVPSCASADYGQPFAKLFAKYDGDFYKIDPLLFSPAVVTLVNIETGNSFQFGKLNPEVLANSFST